jgi:2-keto-4-pentenoate hydratase
MRAQLARRRERLDAGERALGWKVGFGTPAAMERLGTSAPLVGFLMEGARLESGAACSLSGWRNPALEPEIAVHMGRDLGSGADRSEVQASIRGLGPAIELADVDPPPTDPEAILAGNIFQRHVLLGPVDAGRDGCTDDIAARVLTNGAEAERTNQPTALTGDLIEIVALVAATLEAHGERLRSGDVVITGSVVPPMTVAPGDEVEVEMPPLGSLAVRFTG